MSEPDLHQRLRAYAEHLERASRRTTATDVIRTGRVGSRDIRHSLGVALAVAAAAVFVIVGAVVIGGAGEGGGVSTIDRADTTESPQPSASDPAGTDVKPSVDEDPGGAAEQGIAVVDSVADEVVVLDDTGAVLATLPFPTDDHLGADATAAVVDADVVTFVGASNAEAPPGCGNGAGAGGVRIALCGGERHERTQIVQVAPDGRVQLIVGGPDGERVGYWHRAIPSPDGARVLGQWSGECEATTVHVAELAPAPGAFRPLADVEAQAIGWLDDGRALVQTGPGNCGQGDAEPGVYAYDLTSGARQLLHPVGSSSAAAMRWYRQPPGRAHTVLTEALTAIGVPATEAEESHAGLGVFVASVNGYRIPVAATPVSGAASVWFTDLVTEAAPTAIGSIPAVTGEADIGAFVAYTCGAHVWSFGGAGTGDRTPQPVLETLAEQLLPHLYCTVGSPPSNLGHGGVSGG